MTKSKLMVTLALAFGIVSACNYSGEVGDKTIDLTGLEVVGTVVPEPPDLPFTGDVLASEAKSILKSDCASCHNAAQKQGNFGLVEDLDALIASQRYVIPGDPENSLLFKKLATMPPGAPLGEKKKKVIENWIAAAKVDEQKVFSSKELLKLQSAYLKTIPANEKKDTRFFSLHTMNNGKYLSTQISTVRKGFFKVLNSISQSPKIIIPQSIAGSNDLLYPVNIKLLGIKTSTFDSLMKEYNPYCLDPAALNEEEKALVSSIGTNCLLIRMDWFTATATLPRLYPKLLGQGETRQELDAQLGVNIVENINNGDVIRSGFQDSGVSSQARIIERHVQSINGLPYWISYDFQELTGKGNILKRPFGPFLEPDKIVLPKDSDDNSTSSFFEHDGGEVIYQLPNGMLAYYLATGEGKKIDKGPTSIVKQTGAPEQFVSAIVNGVSCMSCHGSGLIHKDDDIREFVNSEGSGFSTEEIEHVNRIYGLSSEMKTYVDRDNAEYLSALKLMGIDYTKADPVNETYRIYNDQLSATQVMAELGLETSKEAFDLVLQDKEVKVIWAALSKPGGFVSREAFSIGLSMLAHVPELRRFDQPNTGDHIITPNCMAESNVFMETCIVKISEEEKKLKLLSLPVEVK